MPRGDKSAYTDKQKRQARHIEEGYEKSGVNQAEAQQRAWATVNKESGGGKKSGSGCGKAVDHSASRKDGVTGGAASVTRTAAERSASARKAAGHPQAECGSEVGMTHPQDVSDVPSPQPLRPIDPAPPRRPGQPIQPDVPGPQPQQEPVQ